MNDTNAQANSSGAPEKPAGNLNEAALFALLKSRSQASAPATESDNSAPASPPPAQRDSQASEETMGDGEAAAAEAPAPEALAEQPQPETASAPVEETPPNDIPTEEPANASEESTATKLAPEVAEAIAEAKLDKGNAKAVKRIHRLVDERDALRNRALAAEQKLAELEAKPPAEPALSTPAPAVGQDPLARHPDIMAADKELSDVRNVLAWAEANPDGAEIKDPKGGEGRYYDADAIREIRRNAEERKGELMATRAATMTQLRTAWNAAQQQAHADAVKIYPWLADTKSPLQAEAKAILRDVPELRRLIKCELAIGDMLRGREMREKGAPETGGLPVKAVPTNRTPPKVVTAPGTGAPSTDSLARDIQQAEAQYRKTGKEHDLKTLVALRARREQPQIRAAA